MTTIAFLPPSSRLTRFRRRAARSAIRLAGRRVAGEGDDLHVRALDERVADVRAAAGDQVHGARREAGLGHQLDEQHRAVRRVAGRLEHDRVAGDERRHHLPARDRHREVPGRDDPDDADRLADAHRPLVGQLGRDCVAECAAPLAGHQERDVDAFLDVAARLGEHLAHLAGHRAGEALLVLRHELAEAVEDLAALRSGRPSPAALGVLGRPHGPRDVGRGAGLEAADDVARVGGVAALERRAGLRIRPTRRR